MSDVSNRSRRVLAALLAVTLVATTGAVAISAERGGTAGSVASGPDRVITGTLQDGQDAVHTVRLDDDVAEVTVTLIGPTGADFDLYASVNGYEPSATSFDAAANGYGKKDAVTIDAGNVEGPIKLLVQAWRGSGKYRVEVEKVRDTDPGPPENTSTPPGNGTTTTTTTTTTQIPPGTTRRPPRRATRRPPRRSAAVAPGSVR